MPVSIGGQLLNTPIGAAQNIGPFTIPQSSVNDVNTQALSLASGANTITLPTSFTPGGVIILPPPTSTVTLILKGVTGDTGINLSPSLPTVLSFPAAPSASFVITTGGVATGVTTFIFF